MRIQLFNGQWIEKDSITSDVDVAALHCRPDERTVLDFIQKWERGLDTFYFHTSGSTGKPKKIKITRSKLAYSARCTLDYLNIRSHTVPLSFLLWLSPQFIGGMMVVARALIADADLLILPPDEPLRLFDSPIDLCSMVPLQVQKLQESKQYISQFRNVLIGGAPLDSVTERNIANYLNGNQHWYATYGMTETASHVALRKLNEDDYHGLGDIQFTVNENDQLTLEGTITDHQKLVTNDLVKIKNHTSFKWVSRFDFVINSGGYKVYPEVIEKKIKEQLSWSDIVLTWIPDSKLGQKLILLSAQPKDIAELSNTDLHPFQIPKEIKVVDVIPKTLSGKLDRKKANEIASKLS